MKAPDHREVAANRPLPVAECACWCDNAAAVSNLPPCGAACPTPTQIAVSTEDFDLQELASYLHLQYAQVTRMVERGQIPGRKVGGEWRFSRPEIHHWLEERIGALEADQLEHLEAALHRADRRGEPHEFTLSELLPQEAVAVPLAARTGSAVIRAMVELATNTGMLWDPEKFAEAVRQREQLCPTAMPGGFALLHPRRPQGSILAQPFLALGRTHTGIPFGSTGTGQMTDLFFLILSTDDATHLQTLARLSRVLGQPDTLDSLREAEDAYAAREVLLAKEAELFA